MIKDRNIAWNVKRDFIDFQQFNGISVDRLASLAAGAPVFQEIVAAAELAGLAIAAAGDEINHLWKLPWDLDRDQPIQMRIWFAHATTDTDNPDWVINLKGVGNQEALSDPADSGDVTLTFPALAVAATANAIEKTSWQSTGANPFASTDIFAGMCVECNGLGSAGANEISGIGVEIAYAVKATGESEKRDLTDVTLPALY